MDTVYWHVVFGYNHNNLMINICSSRNHICWNVFTCTIFPDIEIFFLTGDAKASDIETRSLGGGLISRNPSLVWCSGTSKAFIAMSILELAVATKYLGLMSVLGMRFLMISVVPTWNNQIMNKINISVHSLNSNF